MSNINSELKKLIFSYLRKQPQKNCVFCKDVCVWDKKVKEYFKPFFAPKGTIYCLDCYSLYLQTFRCNIN
jgi:hypothetical protein